MRHKQKITAALTLAIAALCYLAGAAIAVEEPPATAPAQADGYYLLGTAQDLLWFAAAVNAGDNSVNGQLLRDIDLSDERWTPIGNWDFPYTGHFDGQGYTVTLQLKDGWNLGLFNEAGRGALIENLTVAGDIAGGQIGAIASSAEGSTIKNCVNRAFLYTDSMAGGIVCAAFAGALIEDCLNYGDIRGNDNGYNNMVGGIAGSLEESTVSACRNYGALRDLGGGSAGEAIYVGGVAGSALTGLNYISDCHNYGAVTGKNRVGGILGGEQNKGQALISRCANEGSIILLAQGNTGMWEDNFAVNRYTAGGLVGYLCGNSRIDACYNSGALACPAATGPVSLGGIVGASYGNLDIKLSNCYNSGPISAASGLAQAGGILGSDAGSQTLGITNCYNSGTVQAAQAGGIAAALAATDNISNNYYLLGTAAAGLAEAPGASEQAQALSAGQLQALAAALGSAYKNGAAFPILSWQPEQSIPEQSQPLLFDEQKLTLLDGYTQNGADGKICASPGADLQFKLAEDAVPSGMVAEVYYQIDGGAALPLAADEKGVYTIAGAFISGELKITVRISKAQPEFSVTLKQSPGGTITSPANQAKFAEGQVVELRISLDNGYRFGSWLITDSAGGASIPLAGPASTRNNSFRMPAADVSISADLQEDSVTPPPAPASSGGKKSDSADSRPLPSLPASLNIASSATVIPEPLTPLGAPGFADVPPSHWAYPYIISLAENGFVAGKTASEFCPGELLSRAELLTILARMSGDALPAAYSGPFVDVAAASYYEQAVAWGVKSGVARGTSPTAFSPHLPVSRQDMAVMLLRYTVYQGYGWPTDIAPRVFSDSARIQPYALTAVGLLEQAGIISGYADGSFRPQAATSRAEAAKMLTLTYQLLQQQ